VYRLILRLHQGIETEDLMWLDDVIQRVDPGGDYLGQRTTKQFIHSEEWLKPQLGTHSSYDTWVKGGQPEVITEAREVVDRLLENYEPHPLSDDVERELDQIQSRAKMEV
jgi:trimethylamine:corrinoid methyltransferase-like protein